MDSVEHKQKPNKSNPTYQVMTLAGIGLVAAATKHFENYGITMERVSRASKREIINGRAHAWDIY
jgi:hypothetical protein